MYDVGIPRLLVSPEGHSTLAFECRAQFPPHHFVQGRARQRVEQVHVMDLEQWVELCPDRLLHLGLQLLR